MVNFYLPGGIFVYNPEAKRPGMCHVMPPKKLKKFNGPNKPESH
jgi:hypothetical protein